MDEYELLNTGVPGETTRLMPRQFLDLKIPFRSNKSVIRKILSDRAKIYRDVFSEDILNYNLIEKSVEKSNGDLPFAIFTDIIVTNKSTGNLNSVFENIDILVQVVLNNFNRMVPPHKGIHNPISFKNRIMNFIDNEKF
jgi:hypothetical protein